MNPICKSKVLFFAIHKFKAYRICRTTNISHYISEAQNDKRLALFLIQGDVRLRNFKERRERRAQHGPRVYDWPPKWDFGSPYKTILPLTSFVQTIFFLLSYPETKWLFRNRCAAAAPILYWG